ncbi:stalk domain-containing protein [Paenibacillus aurantiacus]|uniref:Stalk domain-containing protein n=1 Tax=Paenibacillus aurantiacus TaxID=1936118 RepID=A0ABV5KXY1_9BACL
MKKKVLISIGIVSLMAVSAIAGAYAANKLTLVVNGQVSTAEPKVINGTTYIPLRAAAELLGAEVGYDSKSSVVSVTSKGQAAQAAAGTFKASGFVFTQLEARKNALDMYEITVNITNSNDKDVSGVLFSAVFYDSNGKRLGTANGSTSDLVKGDTKTTTMITTDDITNYASVKFQIDGQY